MIYKGIPVSAGISIGPVFVYKPFTPAPVERIITAAECIEEIRKYETAIQAADAELQKLCAELQARNDEKYKIFRAHRDILTDVALDEDIRTKICDDLYASDWAIERIFTKYTKQILKAKDELIRERSADFQDVRTRVLRCLYGKKTASLSDLSVPVILFAHDLFPSDTASLRRENVLAIVTEAGGATSHTAIIAKANEIPALLGVNGALGFVVDGQQVIVDAVNGNLITEADDETIRRYIENRDYFIETQMQTKTFLPQTAITQDGIQIEINLNIGSADHRELEGAEYVDGVGLFRTEFLYMGRPALPNENEQFEIYKKVLLRFGKRPVTLRTLDIGGDKQLECLELPKEDNPFLGNRALRLCFSLPEVFMTQLRAALRASVFGNLQIMFPMVGSLNDIHRAKAMVAEAKATLLREAIPFDEYVKIGIMIEIPSIAIIADLAAHEVDFASIGTNDLCQYLTAVDRLNPCVSAYYQSFHPAMVRIMATVIQAFNDAGKPICVCGEYGGDPCGAALLLGLGIRRLSMGMASVAQIKRLILSADMNFFRSAAEKALNCTTAADIEALLQAEIESVLEAKNG